MQASERMDIHRCSFRNVAHCQVPGAYECCFGQVGPTVLIVKGGAKVL